MQVNFFLKNYGKTNILWYWDTQISTVYCGCFIKRFFLCSMQFHILIVESTSTKIENIINFKNFSKTKRIWNCFCFFFFSIILYSFFVRNNIKYSYLSCCSLSDCSSSSSRTSNKACSIVFPTKVSKIGCTSVSKSNN